MDDNIYNFDESSTQIGVISGSTVIVPAGTEQVFIDDLDNKELVTNTECISGSGYYVPSMITFKGAYHLRKHFDNDTDSDILWTRSNSGFVNNKLTL